MWGVHYHGAFVRKYHCRKIVHLLKASFEIAFSQNFHIIICQRQLFTYYITHFTHFRNHLRYALINTRFYIIIFDLIKIIAFIYKNHYVFMVVKKTENSALINMRTKWNFTKSTIIMHVVVFFSPKFFSYKVRFFGLNEPNKYTAKQCVCNLSVLSIMVLQRNAPQKGERRNFHLFNDSGRSVIHHSRLNYRFGSFS